VSRYPARLPLGRLPTQLPLFVAIVAAACFAGALSTRADTLPSKLVLALPLGIVIAAGLLTLASVRPGAALAAAFALLAVATTEPAPVDFAFALIIVGTLGLVPPPALPGFVLVPLVLFVTVTFASAMNATDTGQAIHFTGITIYLVVVAVWLTGVFRIERLARLAIDAYLVVAAVSGGLAALALYVGFPGSGVFLYDNFRANGLFQDPNVFGPFLVPAAAILLDSVGREGLGTRRGRLALTGFVLASAGVIVAYSRAAWLAYALATTTVIIAYALRRGGPRAAMRSAMLLASGAVAGYLMLAITGSLAFFHHRSGLQGYDTERFAAQSSAFDLMTKHVFGYGPGQTEVDFAVSTHSIYARAAFEQGLFGLALVLVLLLVTLWCAVVVAARTQAVFGIGTAGLLGSWIGLMANSAFIDTLHWRHLWVVAALIWTAYLVTDPTPARRRRRASALV
jgi:hypothetical protein